MAVKRGVKVTRYVCDHKGCTEVQYVEQGEFPIGLTGTVTEHTESTGTGALSWFACSAEHVAGAVERAIESYWEVQG